MSKIILLATCFFSLNFPQNTLSNSTQAQNELTTLREQKILLQNENSELEKAIEALRAKNAALLARENSITQELTSIKEKNKLRRKKALEQLEDFQTEAKREIEGIAKYAQETFTHWQNTLNQKTQYYKEWLEKANASWKEFKGSNHTTKTASGRQIHIKQTNAKQSLNLTIQHLDKRKNDLNKLADEEKTRLKPIITNYERHVEQGKEFIKREIQNAKNNFNLRQSYWIKESKACWNKRIQDLESQLDAWINSTADIRKHFGELVSLWGKVEFDW